MSKKKPVPTEQPRQLPPEYTSVDYPPPDHDRQIPVRGGARKPSDLEVEEDRKSETPAQREQ